MDELLSEFITETRETLAPLAGEVIAWEKAPDDRARLDSIFRFVHTVKGSCGFLDLPRLERLSHAAEGALAQVREGTRSPDGALVSAVLAIIDRIGEMVDALDAGTAYPEGGDEAMILALEPGGPAPVNTTAPAAATPASRLAARTIRLPVDLLDRMMGGVSDLVLARNDLSRRLRERSGDAMLDAAFERLSGCIADMRDAITRTRMQRIEHVFTVLPRMVRDLAHDLGKPVALVVEGADTELDREMIEMIRDPLTHIVRNAIDHGIEPSADRRAAGKPETGTLRVSARQAGNQILIDIADDGRGVDSARLVAKAIAVGIVSADDAVRMSPARRLALMFEPGLSTAPAITAVSGRGVGMDVVRANVERIGGVVEIDSRPGAGTKLTLRVPLTLTIIPALTVSVGDQHYAIPRSAIEEIVRIDRGARIDHVGGQAVAVVRGRRLAVAALGEVLRTPSADAPILVILRPAGGESYALAVGAVHDHEELVVKPAAPAVMAAGIYAGTTLPDTGRPMLLLDPAGIAEAAGIGTIGVAAEAADADAAPVAATGEPMLLFVDRDGMERAVRLALVERIEDADATRFITAAGRARLAHQGRLLPLFAVAPMPVGRGGRILLLNDGVAEIAYAIDRVVDIRPLSDTAARAAAPGLAAGALLVDGRAIELIDAHWLFAALSAAPPATGAGAQPLCVLADDEDRWTRDVLRPLIEAAGYRVVLGAAPAGSAPAVTIAGDRDGGQDASTGGGGTLVRLRTQAAPARAGDASIYRYDRDALLAAVAGAVRRRA